MATMPLIGISGSIETKEPRVFLLQTYFNAVSRAGAIPLLLNPHMSNAAIEQCMDALDGLLLAGGGDVDPRHFGQEPVKEIGEIIPIRDQVEFALIKAADSRRPMPILGICRGLQVLNVAAGGSLYQDLPTQYPTKDTALLNHSQEDSVNPTAHSVQLKSDSMLHKLLGAKALAVNSMHHQAVERPGSGYRVVAHSEDGVVEAIEHTDHPFRLAVQWHPERMTDEASLRLFDGFIESAKQYGGSKR